MRSQGLEVLILYLLHLGTQTLVTTICGNYYCVGLVKLELHFQESLSVYNFRLELAKWGVCTEFGMQPLRCDVQMDRCRDAGNGVPLILALLCSMSSYFPILSPCWLTQTRHESCTHPTAPGCAFSHWWPLWSSSPHFQIFPFTASPPILSAFVPLINPLFTTYGHSASLIEPWLNMSFLWKSERRWFLFF